MQIPGEDPQEVKQRPLCSGSLRSCWWCLRPSLVFPGELFSFCCTSLCTCSFSRKRTRSSIFGRMFECEVLRSKWSACLCADPSCRYEPLMERCATGTFSKISCSTRRWYKTAMCISVSFILLFLFGSAFLWDLGKRVIKSFVLILFYFLIFIVACFVKLVVHCHGKSVNVWALTINAQNNCSVFHCYRL